MDYVSLADLLVEQGKLDRQELQKLLPAKDGWASFKREIDRIPN